MNFQSNDFVNCVTFLENPPILRGSAQWCFAVRALRGGPG
jgi:hypothetical protein